MPSGNFLNVRSCAQPLLIAVLAAATASAFAAPIESKDHRLWRELVHANPAPAQGCFHATYPSTAWVQDLCHALPQRTPSPPRIPGHVQPAATGSSQLVGDGHDYSIGIQGTISRTIGNFPVVAGVTSEASVGVPEFGGGGILGPNEYTLQINTQFAEGGGPCANVPYCLAWQQFIYSPDYYETGSAAVFMQYWLIYYTYTQPSCPKGWWSDGGWDCYTNSRYYMPAPNVPIDQLGSEVMSASARAGGPDTAVFTLGDTAYSINAPDKTLDLATWWNSSEFNIVGNAGGSRAVFNPGSLLLTKVAVQGTSTAKPSCQKDSGTTGETNNLDLGSCNAYPGRMPFILFRQSLPPRGSASGTNSAN